MPESFVEGEMEKTMPMSQRADESGRKVRTTPQAKPKLLLPYSSAARIPFETHHRPQSSRLTHQSPQFNRHQIATKQTTNHEEKHRARKRKKEKKRKRTSLSTKRRWKPERRATEIEKLDRRERV
ncbi:unnamed protein product [Microthlaspi erraticum]|uniref:Uncharacterized protein n=1 Tax=Microthlaspi erraticum TaxID=1685480 RepID=A0A6D2JLU5_9BRAS|nr:unnamed protein product [Microthlaspi erraticum]